MSLIVQWVKKNLCATYLENVLQQNFSLKLALVKKEGTIKSRNTPKFGLNRDHPVFIIELSS